MRGMHVAVQELVVLHKMVFKAFPGVCLLGWELEPTGCCLFSPVWR